MDRWSWGDLAYLCSSSHSFIHHPVGSVPPKNPTRATCTQGSPQCDTARLQTRGQSQPEGHSQLEEPYLVAELWPLGRAHATQSAAGTEDRYGGWAESTQSKAGDMLGTLRGVIPRETHTWCFIRICMPSPCNALFKELPLPGESMCVSTHVYACTCVYALCRCMLVQCVHEYA